MATGPFFRGLSRVWTLAWGRDWRLTGPQMTVPWGELASDWLSELEVESSLNEVPLSPSPLWFLQQQSHGGEDQRDGPPGKTEKEKRLTLDLMQSYFFPPFFSGSVIMKRKTRQWHKERLKLVRQEKKGNVMSTESCQ